VNTRIHPLRSQFASKTTEAEYRAYSSERRLHSNRVGILLGAVLFALYAILDVFNLSDPIPAIQIRLAAAAFAAVVLFLLSHPKFSAHHESWTVGVVVLFGAVMNYIIAREGSLENDYYVGLIQAAVILSFLLRVGFGLSCIALVLIYLGFVGASFSTPDEKETTLQLFVLATMFATCGCGIFVIERYRRTEFLQARTIARQNAQLSEMLSEAQEDNRRKIAALNTLVHFVRTPVHQIVGFTDIVLSTLKSAQGETPSDSREDAEQIKAASSELLNNVAKLLVYHRLDEHAERERTAVYASELVRDLKDEVSAYIDCTLEFDTDAAADAKIETYEEGAKACFTSLAEFYRARAAEAAHVRICAAWREGAFVVSIADDGAPIPPERFTEMTTPLVKLTDYLTTAGSNMPMVLRTVARGARLCEGAFDLRADEAGQTLILRLPDLKGREPAEAEAA